ncbi:MAG TPA: PilZ domain-containing protein [Candidatus Binataceae bacterium]|nr:PilZ domain-containing protein [Candidatus Binataceae bacterium]
MNSATEIRALLVTQDGGLASTFTEISREFGIQAHKSVLHNRGIPPELSAAKFEALLIDFETVSQTAAIFAGLRQSPANHNAVVFAVVSNADARQRAQAQGATFVVERPLEAETMRRVLHAAYGLMTRERRRYFRCAAQLAVTLVRDSGEEVECKTINISSNGMGVSTPRAFDMGEKLHISLQIGEAGSPIRAQATVAWDDKHGKTGLSVECADPKMQVELDSWLDAQFQALAGKNV